MLKLLSCTWSQNLVLNKSVRFIRGLFLLTFFCLIPVFTLIGLGGLNSIFTKFSAVENHSTDEKRDFLITFDEKDQNNQDFLDEVNSDLSDEKRDILKTFDEKDQNNQDFREELKNYSMDEKRDILKTFDEKDQNNQGFPINPFDLMNQINKIGAMEDATSPSDALDEALNAFDESEY